MTEELSYYATPGLMTAFGPCPPNALDGLPEDPAGVCRLAQGLLLHEAWAPLYEVNLPPERSREPHLRSVTAVIRRLLEIDPAPLAVPRSPSRGRRPTGSSVTAGTSRP
jgi:hypothetical protein